MGRFSSQRAGLKRELHFPSLLRRDHLPDLVLFPFSTLALLRRSLARPADLSLFIQPYRITQPSFAQAAIVAHFQTLSLPSIRPPTIITPSPQHHALPQAFFLSATTSPSSRSLCRRLPRSKTHRLLQFYGCRRLPSRRFRILRPDPRLERRLPRSSTSSQNLFRGYQQRHLSDFRRSQRSHPRLQLERRPRRRRWFRQLSLRLSPRSSWSYERVRYRGSLGELQDPDRRWIEYRR